MKYQFGNDLFPNPICLTVKKSDIPIIFLDSNILIELTKIKNDISKNEYKAELEQLYDLLIKGIKQNQIICPKAMQDMEIGFVKSKQHNLKILNKLSKGIEFKSEDEIRKDQTDLLFSKFLKNKKEITISFEDAFINNPLKKKGMVINLNHIWPDNVAKRIQAEKIDRTESLNKLKESGDYRKNFKEQLCREMTFELGTLIPKMRKKILQQQKLTWYEKKFWYEHQTRMKKFKIKGDDNERLSKYLAFMSSTYYFQIPFLFIDRNITTYILLYGKFDNGDFIDSKNASAYLPYCNYYFTDKKQHNLLKKLKLDKKYQTEVFCLKNVEKLIKKLEEIVQ